MNNMLRGGKTWIGRRDFALLMAGAVVAPRIAWAQSTENRTVFYVTVGSDITLYNINGDALTADSTVSVPAMVQYLWRHPVKNIMYVCYTNQFTSTTKDVHGVASYKIDPKTGKLTPFASTAALPARPINITVDKTGNFLFVAFNAPSNLHVYSINADGSVGMKVEQKAAIDAGIYAHQVRVDPTNNTVILCARGNDATSSKPEDPGAIKVFHLGKNGQLTDERSIAIGNGLGFGPRHVDFHPTRPLMYVSMERENQLMAYMMDKGEPSAQPVFSANTLIDPSHVKPGQVVGPIHVHPNGRFVYLANRADGTTEFDGKRVFIGGENNVAVFAINQQTGEPKLIQNIDTHSYHCRTFSIHPNGKLLVTASVLPMLVRDGEEVKSVPAALTVFSIGDDGRLSLVRKYDIDTAKGMMFWCGMTSL